MTTTPELIEAPEPPIPPGDGACCNSGCAYCVFDMYQEELERYRLALKEWQEQCAAQAGAQSGRQNRESAVQPPRQ